MTDKEKIKEWIETRKLCTMDEHMAFYNDKAKEDYRFLSEIEELIKALQEEPSKFDAAIQEGDDVRYNEDLGCRINLSQLKRVAKKEEPVSEDLEEAAWLHYDRNKPLMPPELDLHKELIDFFKAGARWKEQNDSNLSKVLERDNLDEMAEEYSSCTYLEEVLGEGDREVLKARLKNTFKAGAKWQKRKDSDSVSEELEEASKEWLRPQLDKSYAAYGETKQMELTHFDGYAMLDAIEFGAKWQKEKEYTCYEEAFEDGAKWKVENLWKPADGDDFPEIDREVVAFQEIFPTDVDVPSLLKIVIAHRPNPEGYDGKSIATGIVEHYTPKTYGEGGWNIPDVRFWLDVKLPKEIEL